MTKEQIKERIEYLKIELAHHGHHDGWVLKGMKEEKIVENFWKFNILLVFLGIVLKINL